MSDPNVTPELKKMLTEVLEETTSGFETHPDPERLFAYSSDALSAQEQDALQDHLSLCRDCLDRLRLDPEDPLGQEREGVADLEVRRAWREIEAHFRESRARRELERQRKRSRLYQIAAAACLAVAAGMAVLAPPISPEGTGQVPSTPGLDGTGPRTTGPAVNVGVFDVMRSRVRSGSESSEELGETSPRSTALTVAAGVDAFTLIFLLESGDYDAYELKILDSRRNELWTTQEVLVQEDRATLSLSRAHFESGGYFVEIYCWRGGEATIWEYPIHLVYQ